MALYPIFVRHPELGDDLVRLEALIKKYPDQARFALAYIDEARQSGLCPECGNINNPGHAVQAGGYCACNYSAPCFGKDEGHYGTYKAGNDKATCLECGEDF